MNHNIIRCNAWSQKDLVKLLETIEKSNETNK